MLVALSGLSKSKRRTVQTDRKEGMTPRCPMRQTQKKASADCQHLRYYGIVLLKLTFMQLLLLSQSSGLQATCSKQNTDPAISMMQLWIANSRINKQDFMPLIAHNLQCHVCFCQDLLAVYKIAKRVNDLSCTSYTSLFRMPACKARHLQPYTPWRRGSRQKLLCPGPLERVLTTWIISVPSIVPWPLISGRPVITLIPRST